MTSTAENQLLLPMLVIGLGFGAGLAQVPNIALSAVRVDERGEATGLNTTAQDLGVGFGAGVVGTLLLSPILGGDGIHAGMITLISVAILTFLVVSLLPVDVEEQ